MKISRSDLKNQLLSQAKQSFESRDETGMFQSFFKSGLPLPEWKCTEGEHVIDILPWIVGEQYPTKAFGGRGKKKGNATYLLDLWVHFGVGSDESAYVCLNRNYGEPCPVCEYVASLRKQAVPDDETINKIKAKRRSIYYILCYDSEKEENLGPQIWNVAHFYMEKHLAEHAVMPRGGGFTTFAAPTKEDGGSQVFFRVKGQRLNTEYSGHRFLERDYDLDMSVLESLPPLDELIVIPTYKDLYRAIWGKDPNEADSEDEMEEEVQAPSRPSARIRRPLKSEPEDIPKEMGGNIPPPEEEEIEQTEEGESSACPGGGVFGVDIDKLSHCPSCAIWDDCMIEAEKRESKAEKKPVTRPIRRPRRG